MLVTVAAATCSTLTEAELACEEAILHLSSCCPQLDAHAFRCEERHSCLVDRQPDVSVAISRCLRALDCEAIAAQNMCETARRESSKFGVQQGRLVGAGECTERR